MQHNFEGIFNILYPYIWHTYLWALQIKNQNNSFSSQQPYIRKYSRLKQKASLGPQGP